VHEEVFQRGFRKLHTDEVVELYRHGIVHGMVVNYGNVVVATKAWNYLFAVVDWAVAREQAAVPPKPEPTWRDLLDQFRTNAELKKRTAAWQPSTLRPGDDGFDTATAYQASVRYLELWQQQNWGHMADLVSHLSGRPLASPREIKQEYTALSLDSFEIREVRAEALAVTMVEVDLTINEKSRHGTLRWIYEDEQGSPVAEPNCGEWRLIWWGPHAILDREPV
jgi:hypothetical protein